MASVPKQNTDDARKVMEGYWQEHSGHASLVDMMLDENAAEYSDKDVEEIFRMVPSMDGKRVLELGAGIGRFTTYLADRASSVVAVDFIDKFVQRNREVNAGKSNVEVLCADATRLEFPPNSFDVVFSNWLLMYLTDEETSKLLQNVLSWLSPNGYLFFRESCNKPSGNKPRTSNPTIYRKLIDYDWLLNSASSQSHHFDVLFVRSNQVYVELKKNPFQLCWLAQKISSNSKGILLRSECIEAKRETVMQELTESVEDSLAVSTTNRLALKSAEEVLEIGCGLGSTAFYLARAFKVQVYALDLSVHMIQQALERFDEKYKQLPILFELSDATRKNFKEGHFHAIYSRDTLVHISNKPALVANFYRWLKPGGRLVICDFALGSSHPDSKLSKYFEQQHCLPLASSQLTKQLESAGFLDVEVFDETAQMKSKLSHELDKYANVKAEFLRRFSEADYSEVISDVETKLRFIEAGQLIWTVVVAHKSLDVGRTPPMTPDNA